MPANAATRVMLGRRPPSDGAPAFGHVDVDKKGRDQLHEVVEALARSVKSKTKVDYHPDDLPDEGEVLVADLAGIDQSFQPNAAWSLERAVAAVRATGTPQKLKEQAIRDGGWSFYVIRTRLDGTDAAVIRTQTPTRGLKAESKLVTRFTGGELKTIEEPLVAFDFTADVVVLDDKAYMVRPRAAERQFVDADAVKARAGSITSSFTAQIRAPLAPKTVDAIQKVCSGNANIGRRVERLFRDGELRKVTAAKVRDALPDAGLDRNDFGSSGKLQAVTDQHATVLIDIVADLYYQPRFADAPRRVAAYRRVKTGA